MVLVAVEVLPVESKPPAAVVVRISKGEGHDLGAEAPFSTCKGEREVRLSCRNWSS